MGNFTHVYDFKEEKTVSGIKFFFISRGARDVVKIIQYSFVQAFNGKDVYNLGFGDYDIETDSIVDDVNTNNGDSYKVLNTVLSTISIFFENYGNAVLMVQGSDSRPEFKENCRKTCLKKCKDECRNFKRRIKIYSGYVNKNYSQLIIKYKFYGGIADVHGQVLLEPYICYKNYDSVLLFRKSLIL